MEQIVNKNIYIGIAMLVIVPMLNASPTRDNSNPFVKGTVVHVQKHKGYSPDSTIGGSNPSDAPLTSRYFAYEVSVRVDCKTYVGRHETPFNCLPSSFTPHQPIKVHLAKHVFDLSNHPDMRIGLSAAVRNAVRIAGRSCRAWKVLQREERRFRSVAA